MNIQILNVFRMWYFEFGIFVRVRAFRLIREAKMASRRRNGSEWKGLLEGITVGKTEKRLRLYDTWEPVSLILYRAREFLPDFED